MLTRIKHFTIGALYVAMLAGLFWFIAYPAGAVLPNIFATQPSGNVAASLLDTNFTFLESQGVQGLTTTGSSNAYVATPADAWVTGYSGYSGRALTIIPSFTNTAASTINVSGLGAVSLYKNVSGVATAIASGDMVFGIPAVIVCDGTGFLLTNPPVNTAGSTALTLLSSVNASGAASVSFNSTVITSTYTKYIVEFDGVYLPSGTSLYLTESTNNGVSYLSSNYKWGGSTVTVGSATVTGYGSASDGRLKMDLGVGGAGSLGAAFSGTVKFSNPFLSSSICQFLWELQGGDATIADWHGGGFNTTTTNINNIKFTADSGNITGHFALYGLAP